MVIRSRGAFGSIPKLAVGHAGPHAYNLLSTRSGDETTRAAAASGLREEREFFWNMVCPALCRARETGTIDKFVADILVTNLAYALRGTPPISWAPRPKAVRGGTSKGTTDDNFETIGTGVCYQSWIPLRPEIFAVLYIFEARAGHVQDKKPVETVLQKYNIPEQRTVEKWVAKYRDHSFVTSPYEPVLFQEGRGTREQTRAEFAECVLETGAYFYAILSKQRRK